MILCWNTRCTKEVHWNMLPRVIPALKALVIQPRYCVQCLCWVIAWLSLVNHPRYCVWFLCWIIAWLAILQLGVIVFTVQTFPDTRKTIPLTLLCQIQLCPGNHIVSLPSSPSRCVVLWPLFPPAQCPHFWPCHQLPFNYVQPFPSSVISSTGPLICSFHLLKLKINLLSGQNIRWVIESQ